MNNHQETQYLTLLEDIIDNGKVHDDRTGTGTYRLKNKTLSFDLSEEFPLLTTKKMFVKGIITELLWFLNGDTNLKYLHENGNHIWDKNQENFVEKRKIKNLKTNDGDCGNIYGKQWRNFNGVDQISELIKNIKSDPNSRRHIVSSWNPEDINPYSCCLPPCHVLFQCFVEKDELSLTLYQRSGDFFLGIPFNLASYSILTCMIAHVCDLKPKTFFHFIGDCHVYKNHLNQCKEQLKRTPFKFPKLKIKRKVENIFDFKLEDFEFEDYISHPTIKAEMSV